MTIADFERKTQEINMFLKNVPNDFPNDIYLIEDCRNAVALINRITHRVKCHI